ncbi:hypothetical protein L7F22_047345, partial [Adiantum nelumboides]|nr:hypothetical protein [Adiantum nelumboides]
VLASTPTTEMVEIYAALSQCDAMLGVHGAAMTHVVFMRTGATFIQVVPLGTKWAAATYYDDPVCKLGLKYVEYKSTCDPSLGEDDMEIMNEEANGFLVLEDVYNVVYEDALDLESQQEEEQGLVSCEECVQPVVENNEDTSVEEVTSFCDEQKVFPRFWNVVWPMLARVKIFVQEITKKEVVWCKVSDGFFGTRLICGTSMDFPWEPCGDLVKFLMHGRPSGFV